MIALLLELHARKRAAAREKAAQELARLRAVTAAIESAQVTIGIQLEWEHQSAGTLIAQADSINSVEYAEALQVAQKAAQLRGESLSKITQDIARLLADIRSRIVECDTNREGARGKCTAELKDMKNKLAVEVASANSLVGCHEGKSEGPSGCAIAALVVGVLICMSGMGTCSQAFALGRDKVESSDLFGFIFLIAGLPILFGILLCLPFVLRLSKQQREQTAAREAAAKARTESIQRTRAATKDHDLSLEKSKMELEEAEKRLNAQQQQLSERESRAQTALNMLAEFAE